MQGLRNEDMSLEHRLLFVGLDMKCPQRPICLTIDPRLVVSFQEVV